MLHGWIEKPLQKGKGGWPLADPKMSFNSVTCTIWEQVSQETPDNDVLDKFAAAQYALI
jgi:hypothetical protein